MPATQVSGLRRAEADGTAGGSCLSSLPGPQAFRARYHRRNPPRIALDSFILKGPPQRRFPRSWGDRKTSEVRRLGPGNKSSQEWELA